MEKLIYFPIETSERELDAKLLLAHRALSRGYFVIIGRKEKTLKAAERLGFGIYMMKMHELKKFPQTQNMQKTGITCVALDEEGLVFADDKTFLDRSNPHKIDHIDIVFTWGSYQRKLLLKENPSLELKTIPVGHPRFDLLRPEFSSLNKPNQERICKTWGKYVLINTNFVPGNFNSQQNRSYFDVKKLFYSNYLGRNITKKELDLLFEEKKYYEGLCEQYKEMLLLISIKFPQINFILRPHPSEDHEKWKEAFNGYKNINVVFEGNVIDWIKGALMVIHTGCTTGIEAWALKKPVIAYNPNINKTIEPELPNKFSLKISNINKLCNVLEDIINGNFKNKFGDKSGTARLFIESINGELSSERIMNVVESLPDIKNVKYENIEKNRYLKPRDLKSAKSAIIFGIIKFLRKYRSSIMKLTGKSITDYIFQIFQQKYPGIMVTIQKFPELSSVDIQSKLSFYDFVFNNSYSENYLVRQIDVDTYIIHKR